MENCLHMHRTTHWKGPKVRPPFQGCTERNLYLASLGMRSSVIVHREPQATGSNVSTPDHLMATLSSLIRAGAIWKKGTGKQTEARMLARIGFRVCFIMLVLFFLLPCSRYRRCPLVLEPCSAWRPLRALLATRSSYSVDD